MKYIFLINRFSLKKNTEKMAEVIKKVCKRRKIDFEVMINNEKFSTEEIMERFNNTKHMIFAIGGDGSMNRVLNAIIKTNNIFSYIPYGTGNDFDRTAREILEPGENDIDIIRINDRYFMNVACFGIDADIANKGDNVVHNSIIPKSQRYNAAIVAHFIKFQPKKFKLKIGREEEEGLYSTITVCNGRYYGSGFHINPSGLLNDHLMDTYIIDNMHRSSIIKYILKMKKGKHENMFKVKHVQCDHLVIESEIPIKANLDGEVLEDTRFDMKVIKDGFTVYYDPELIKDIQEGMKNAL